MPGTGQGRKACACGVAAGALTLALLAGGCTQRDSAFSGTTTTVDPTVAALTDKVSSFFAGASARGPQSVTNAQPDVNCPPVEVRNGASALTIGTSGDTSAMAVKYQGEFAREARECAVVSGNMVMKVGVQGRVIVGPAGGPGQVEVPLRMAVVEETPGGARPITTKFILIPVTIAPGAGNVLFTHVEEALTFPVPTTVADLDNYIVYVGFDPQSAEAQSKPPRAKPRPKPRLQPAASTN